LNRTSHEGGSNAYDIRWRHSHRGVWPHRLGSIAVIYVCDGVTTCTGSMIGVFEEEGSYEYASDHQGTKSAKEEPHVEPAILVQPLEAEAGEGGDGGESEGFLIPVAGGCPSTKDPCYKHIRHHSGSANEGANGCSHQGGSGCRGGGGNAGDTCRTVAGATGPLAVMTGPGGVILWVIGFGTCELN
jgi:hypothetical protein